MQLCEQMLLSTEGIDLHFTDAAIWEIACLAEDINRSTENIGARRLASIMERVTEHVSFAAPEMVAQVCALHTHTHTHTQTHALVTWPPFVITTWL